MLAAQGNEPLRLLSDSEVEMIREGTLRVLAKTGVKFSLPEAKGVFRKAGLTVDGNDVVHFPARAVEEAIEAAPSQFVREPLDPSYAPVRYGEGQFSVSCGSTPLYVLDLDTGKRRDARRTDVADFARLTDGLAHIPLGNGAVQPSDVPESVVHAIWQLDVARNTAKPAPAYNPLTEKVARDVIELVSIVLGGRDEIGRRKTFAMTGCPNSALFWGSAAIAFVEFAKVGGPITIMPMPFSGSTHPVTLAGLLVQTCAEILSCVVLAQLVRPGTPVICAPYPGIMDMKSATHSMGAPEAGLLGAALAQIFRSYGLPCDIVVGTSDSKLPDGQACYEKMMTMLLAALAGADTATLSGGLLDFAATASFEQLVIDDEIAGNIERVLKGIDVTGDKLLLDAIGEVGHGGNYLSHESTLRHFRDEHFIPTLADRNPRSAWEKAGSKDVVERARERAKGILAHHRPQHLDDDLEREVVKKVEHILEREGVRGVEV